MSRVPLDFVVRTKLGQVRPGARLYIYQRGTTNQVIGWTTESGSTQVTYPLAADLEGRFPNAWYPPGSYDVYSPDDVLNTATSCRKRATPGIQSNLYSETAASRQPYRRRRGQVAASAFLPQAAPAGKRQGDL